MVKHDHLVISLCKKPTTSYPALLTHATNFMEENDFLHAHNKWKEDPSCKRNNKLKATATECGDDGGSAQSYWKGSCQGKHERYTLVTIPINQILSSVKGLGLLKRLDRIC